MGNDDGKKINISSKLIKSQKKTNAKVSLSCVCLYMSAPSSLIKQNQNSLQSVNAAGSFSLSIFKITCLSKIKLKKMRKNWTICRWHHYDENSSAGVACWRTFTFFLRQSFCHHQYHKHEGIIVFTLFSFFRIKNML